MSNSSSTRPEMAAVSFWCAFWGAIVTVVLTLLVTTFFSWREHFLLPTSSGAFSTYFACCALSDWLGEKWTKRATGWFLSLLGLALSILGCLAPQRWVAAIPIGTVVLVIGLGLLLATDGTIRWRLWLILTGGLIAPAGLLLTLSAPYYPEMFPFIQASTGLAAVGFVLLAGALIVEIRR